MLSEVSKTNLGSSHAMYSLRRSSTSFQITSGIPGMLRTRDSIRFLCRPLSRTHSITMSRAPNRVAKLCHISRASLTGLTASIMTDIPNLNCSDARASATTYAASPVSKLLFFPLLIRDASMGSTENIGIFNVSAIPSAAVLFPEPGKPETTMTVLRCFYSIDYFFLLPDELKATAARTKSFKADSSISAPS